NYDFKISNLNNTHIIELLQYDQDLVVKILIESFNSDWFAMKSIYNQEYKPTIDHFNNILFKLCLEETNYKEILNYIKSAKNFISKMDRIYTINTYMAYFNMIYFRLYATLKKIKKSLSKKN
ncbi:MAG: hypothetical protein WBB17_00880, partial [Saprospiraceae bacterium]